MKRHPTLFVVTLLITVIHCQAARTSYPSLNSVFLTPPFAQSNVLDRNIIRSTKPTRPSPWLSSLHSHSFFEKNSITYNVKKHVIEFVRHF